MTLFDDESLKNIVADLVSGLVVAFIVAVISSVFVNKGVSVTNEKGKLKIVGANHVFVRKFKPDSSRVQEAKRSFPYKATEASLADLSAGVLYYSKYPFTIISKRVRTGQANELASEFAAMFKALKRKSFLAQHFPRIYIASQLRLLLKKSGSSRFKLSIIVGRDIAFRLVDDVREEIDGGVSTPWLYTEASKNYTYSLLRFFLRKPEGELVKNEAIGGLPYEWRGSLVASKEEVETLYSYLKSTQSWSDVRKLEAPNTPKNFYLEATRYPHVDGKGPSLVRSDSNLRKLIYMENTKYGKQIQLSGHWGERRFNAVPIFVEDSFGYLLEGTPDYVTPRTDEYRERKVYFGRDGLVLWQLEDGRYSSAWISKDEIEKLARRLIDWKSLD